MSCVALLRVINPAVQGGTAVTFAVKLVGESGELMDLLGHETSNPFIDSAQLKAKNWAEMLSLPLRLPERGYLLAGEEALSYPEVDLSQVGCTEPEDLTVEIPVKAVCKRTPEPQGPQEDWTTES